MKDAGLLASKVDGVYGPMTEGARKSYEKRCSTNSSVVITGVSGPQTLDVNKSGKWTVTASDANGGDLMYAVTWGDEVSYSFTAASNSMVMRPGQSAVFYHSYSLAGVYNPKFTVYNDKGGEDGSEEVSLSVRVGNVSSSSLTVLSPNGGETWAKGTNKTIKWEDNTPLPECNYSFGAASCSFAPTTYSISLKAPNAGEDSGNYLLAVAVSGNSYNWKVGDRYQTTYVIPNGTYTIQVCQTGSNVCDSSDNPFTILNLF